MIRILLAEDQALVRDGLCALLEMEEDLTVRAVANGQEALAAAEAATWDIAVIDVRMPVMDGIACTRELRRRYPSLPILILTTFDDRLLVQECLEAGASAYLLKDIEPEQLIAAVRLLVAGEHLIPGDLARALLGEESATVQTGRGTGAVASGDGQAGRRHAGPETDAQDEPFSEPLTPRQREVLELIAQGFSNQEIAGRLYLSEGTVKNTVSEIYARLGVRDRVQAVLKMLAQR